MPDKRFRIAPIFVIGLLLLGVFGLQGCSACTTARSADVPAETGERDSAAQGGGSAEDEDPAVFEEEPMYTPSYVPNGSEVAVIETDKGTIKFEFYPDDAPNHVAAFVELAKDGFYDGVKFHRVVPGFVVQGGDPLSKTDDPMVGTGGPGYRLAAEFNSRQHLDGTVSMARSQDVDSAGSQFYICLGPQPGLDGDYTVFGQVIEGMDVVQQITMGDVMNRVTIENATE